MSATYGRVYAAIWDEPWDDDTRYVAFYLLTCRHRRTEGLYRLPWPYVIADLGWPEERIKRAWDALLEHGFIEYDREVGIVWIVKALVRQPTTNPNQRTAIVRAVEELPASPVVERFKNAARTLHEGFREGFGEPSPDGFADPPTPTPTPITALSPSGDRADAAAVDDLDQAQDRLQSADVRAVFDAWVESTGRDPKRTRLDDKRRRRIQAGLRSHGLDDCLAAVRGWRHSPHHRGENDRGTVYNDLDVLLRDAKQIETFRDLERQHGRRDTDAGLTARINAGLTTARGPAA